MKIREKKTVLTGQASFATTSKDLKYPFSWEERRPAISERILFIPTYYSDYHLWTFPGWEHPDVFGKKGKVFIEYCSGNGKWVYEKALAQPDCLWIAVERKFERVRKIWAKAQKAKLSNLFIVCGEALTFTTHYLPDHSLEGVYVNFPDPWPKGKHAKNRLFQEPFIKQLARALRPGAHATLVTDDPDYCEQISSEFMKEGSWNPEFPSPYYVTEWPDYGASYFGDLWQSKGRTIHYLNFINS